MAEYANVHFALERLRDNAAEALASLEAMHSSASVSQFDNDAATGGPRVLVLGPPNAGKSTLAKMLTSYAARSGRSPCVVNLDPGEGMFAPPGSFSAAVFGADGVMDIEDAATGGWGGSPVTGGVAGGGTGTVGVKTPLVYQFGAAERVEEAPEWFKGICSRVAMAVTGRFEEDRAVKEAGILVDIGGSVVGARGGYEIVAHVVSEFSSMYFSAPAWSILERGRGSALFVLFLTRLSPSLPNPQLSHLPFRSFTPTRLPPPHCDQQANKPRSKPHPHPRLRASPQRHDPPLPADLPPPAHPRPQAPQIRRLRRPRRALHEPTPPPPDPHVLLRRRPMHTVPAHADLG